MFILTSERLRAEISEPHEAPNTGYRFDRAGFISDVTLDGNTHFCAAEPKNLSHPSTGGRGLCFEFDADLSGEVGEGEYYPKFGVGLIRKDGPYCFYKRYRDVREFPVSMSYDENTAEFVTEPLECLGYAVRTKKLISVRGNVLTVEVSMDNVGKRQIESGEYCHNFLSIDGMAISPDYYLELPGLHDLGILDIPNEYPSPTNFSADGSKIRLKRVETAVSLADIPLDQTATSPFCWKLSHSGAGAFVAGTDYIRPSKIKLWAVDHIVSPEIIQTVSIAPGESFCWKRVWTFDSDQL